MRPIWSYWHNHPGPDFLAKTSDTAGPSLALEIQRNGAGPEIPDAAALRAGEELAEKEYLTLIRWAMRKAPELLRMLRLAYLRGEHSAASAVESDRLGNGLLRDAIDGAARPQKLADVEREHIRRVLSESATVVEAALKLGINNSTLWRKRKRYQL